MSDNRSLLERFMSYVDSNWKWIGNKTKSGYGRICVNYRSMRAHRVSYELFNGPIPNGMYVLHSCDDPLCVNPDHLHLGTAYDNWHEMLSRGRSNFVKGETHGMSKLSKEQVIEIREKYQQGIKQTILAEQYDIRREMVFNIVHKKNWRCIE